MCALSAGIAAGRTIAVWPENLKAAFRESFISIVQDKSLYLQQWCKLRTAAGRNPQADFR